MKYLPHADVFMLYFEGQPTCGRLVLRDEESRRALMLLRLLITARPASLLPLLRLV